MPATHRQVTAWFVVVIAGVSGVLAVSGGLMGPSAGDMSAGATVSGGGTSAGSSGLGIGCLGVVLAAQVRATVSESLCVRSARWLGLVATCELDHRKDVACTTISMQYMLLYASFSLGIHDCLGFRIHGLIMHCPLLQGVYVTQFLPNAPVAVQTVAQQFNAAVGDIS